MNSAHQTDYVLLVPVWTRKRGNVYIYWIEWIEIETKVWY